MSRMLFPLLFDSFLARTSRATRPSNTTICDYYTPLVTGKDNTAASQRELMLLITHTFILGNYTTPNVGINVHGVATPGSFEGHEVYMLPYFDGGYASTNKGGSHGVVKNFLDDGGAVPLEMNKPANTTNSNQYNLLTHVYEYFGTFYGCSLQGSQDFPMYQGRASMYEVHKFMDLDKYQTGFFNQQIVLAVTSLGFEQPDIHFTQKGLEATFSNRCSPATKVIPADAGPQLQSICVAPDCPLDTNADCAAYPDGGPVEQPAIVNASLLGNVKQQNETEAGATASWPAHCVVARGASGTEQCAIATSCAATATSSSGSDGRSTLSTDVAKVSVGWVVAAMLTGMFYFA